MMRVWMNRAKRLCVAAGVVWLVAGLNSAPSISASANAQEASSGEAGQPAVVTFTLDFPRSNPARYSIAIEATGRASYTSAGKLDDQSEEQNYESEFTISPANCRRIFELARQAKYFAGNLESGNHKLAFTGTKTLSYQSGSNSATARYNYSSLEPVRQLTALFQNMASTLEYGHRLDYYHHYQKLALDDELKRMETDAKSGELSEIQSVAPVLKQIVDDSSVINVDRARAQELMAMGARR